VQNTNLLLNQSPAVRDRAQSAFPSFLHSDGR
jgi:hypothetical protein